MIQKILILAILIFIRSCEKKDIDTGSVILFDKELISQLNSKSHDTLVIGSNAYVLDVFLWRDFMPIAPPNGKPMKSINLLREIDSTEIPDNIDLIKQYVVYNDTIWISEYDNEYSPDQLEYSIKKLSVEGPKWGPEIYVDVISNIHDSSTDKDYFIRTKNVYVERTE